MSEEALQFPYPPAINNLSSGIKKLIQAFKDASSESLNYENKTFENVVNSIKNKRAEFHLIAIETTKNSEMLISFGENLIRFFEACDDESVSKEEKLGYLNSLLRDARKNETVTKDTNLKIRVLIEDLTKIYNKLPDRNDVKNVDPKTFDELAKTEQDKAFYKGLAIGVIGLGALIALPAAAFALNAGMAAATGTTAMGAAAEFVKTVARSRSGITAGATTLVSAAAGSKSLSNRTDKEKKATILKQTLDSRKEQWLEESANLHDNVSLMRPILKELEIFWGKKIDQLENLIEEFKISSDRNALPSKLIKEELKPSWNKTIKECEAYSRFILNEVNDDLRNLNQTNRNNRSILN
ncbi:hypothetical protein RclHR1_01650025 [Rhizophagus clarus]|nr:hypothetical protein RclHR1_01650025 [Rhizophagus clarus]